MIYFDHASTTIPSSAVLSYYQEVSKEYFGNSGSLHKAGFLSTNALEKARRDIINSFSLKDYSCVVTSGATEANNLAIHGFSYRYQARGKHLITSLGEHPSVLETFRHLEKEGFDVTYLPLDSKTGAIRLTDLKDALREDTIFISIMAINNETGAISPLEEIRELLSSYPKIIFHSDFTQAAFKGLPHSFYSLPDALSFSAHKFGGQKGHGFLLFRKKLFLEPLQYGGGQEFSYRSGTVDVPGALTTAYALKLAKEYEQEGYQNVRKIRSFIVSYLLSHQEEYVLHEGEKNCPYLLNFSFQKKKSSVIAEALSEKGIYVSTVSACSSKKEEASTVLLAMGIDKELAKNSLRLSFGKENTLDEAQFFIETLEKLRKELINRS